MLTEIDGSPAWDLNIEGMQDGIILGTLRSEDGLSEPPSIEICVDGEPVGDVEVTAHSDGFKVAAKLPSSVLNEGLTTVVFQIASNRSVLRSYTFRAGTALDADVISELSALRAELDALKTAFLIETHDAKLRAVERDLIVAEAVEIATNAIRVQSLKTDD